MTAQELKQEVASLVAKRYELLGTMASCDANRTRARAAELLMLNRKIDQLVGEWEDAVAADKTAWQEFIAIPPRAD